MKLGNRTYEIDWGHFTVLTLIAVLMIAYLLDTRASSLNINNLLFVQPTALVGLVLYLVVLPQTVRRVTEETPEGPKVIRDRGESAEPAGETWTDRGRVAALMGAFGLFVFGLEPLGFDVVSWVFIAVGLYICGERNRLALLIYPPVAAAVLVYGFRALMPYPIDTVIL